MTSFLVQRTHVDGDDEVYVVFLEDDLVTKEFEFVDKL